MPGQCTKYLQRRFNTVHAYSWALHLEKYGFAYCTFKDCHFIALDIDGIAAHYNECAGGGSDQLLFMCSVCNRGTEEEHALSNHYLFSHPQEAKARGITAIAKGKTMPKIITNVRKKSWMEFLSKKGYIKCLIRNCQFITDDIKVMEDHFKICSTGKSYLRGGSYVCASCRGLTRDKEFFKRHSMRCSSMNSPFQHEHYPRPQSVLKVPEVKPLMIKNWTENIRLFRAAKCPRNGCRFVDNSISALSGHYMRCSITSSLSYVNCYECGAWLTNLIKLKHHLNSVHKVGDFAPSTRLVIQENDNVNNFVLKRGELEIQTNQSSQSCFRVGVESCNVEETDEEPKNAEVQVETTSTESQSKQPYQGSTLNRKCIQKKNPSKSQYRVVTPLARLAQKLVTHDQDSSVPVNISVDDQNWTVKVTPSVLNGPKLTGDIVEDFTSIGLFMRREAENLLTCARAKNTVFNVPVNSKKSFRLKPNAVLPPIKTCSNLCLVDGLEHDCFLPEGFDSGTPNIIDLPNIDAHDDSSVCSVCSTEPTVKETDGSIENNQIIVSGKTAICQNSDSDLPVLIEVMNTDSDGNVPDNSVTTGNNTNSVLDECVIGSVTVAEAHSKNGDLISAVQGSADASLIVLKPDNISEDTDKRDNSHEDEKAAEPSSDNEQVPEIFWSDEGNSNESICSLSNPRSIKILDALQAAAEKNFSNAPSLANNKSSFTDDRFSERITSDPVSEKKILSRTNSEIIKSDVFKDKIQEITEKPNTEDPSSKHLSNPKRLNIPRKKLKQKISDVDFCKSNEKNDFLGFSDKSISYSKLNHLLSYCNILGFTAEVQTYPIHVRYDKSSANMENKKASNNDKKNSDKGEGSEQKRSGGTSRRSQRTADTTDSSSKKRKVERNPRKTMKRNTGKEEFQEFVDTLGETSTPKSKRNKGQMNEESDSDSDEEYDEPLAERRASRFRRNDSKEKITRNKSSTDGKSGRNNKNAKADNKSTLVTPSRLSSDESVASLDVNDPKERITRKKSTSDGKVGRNNKNTKADNKSSLVTPSQLSSEDSIASLNANDPKEKITRKTSRNTKADNKSSLVTPSQLSSDESVASLNVNNPKEKITRKTSRNTKADNKPSLVTPSQLSSDDSVASLNANDPKEKITRKTSRNTKADNKSSLVTPSQLSSDESVASLNVNDPKEKTTRKTSRNTKADNKSSLVTPSQLSSDESVASLDAIDPKEKITRKKSSLDGKGGRNNKNTIADNKLSLATLSQLSSDESVDSLDNDKPGRKRVRLSVDDNFQNNKKRKENSSEETPKSCGSLANEETLNILENSVESCHPVQETENEINLTAKGNSDESIAVNESQDPPKKRRGRPKKSIVSGFVEFRPYDETEVNKKNDPVIFSGRTRASRGLVVKSYVEELNNYDELDDDNRVVKRKRGRQKKNPEGPSTSNDSEVMSDDLNSSKNSTPGRTRRPRTYWRHNRHSTSLDEDPHRIGTCVNCRLSMTVSDFKKKHMLVHNFLCWLEGDDPLELNNENAMINWLTRHKKAFPKHIFRCEKCAETKKSVKGFLSHLQFCGKSLEERQKLMAICPVCGRIMMPSSLEQHRPLCIRKVPSNDDEPEIEEEPQQPLSPRKAARQCLSTIADIAPKLIDDGSPRKRKGRGNIDASVKEEDLEASSDDEVFEVNGEISLDVHDAIRELFTMKTKRITKNLKTVWEMSVADGKPLQCPCPSCDFNTPVFSVMNEHYKTCSHDFQGYVCKECKYCSATEREMIRHIKKVHSGQLVAIKSRTKSHPPKRCDNPPGSNYVPFLKKAEIAFNQTMKLAKFFRPALLWTQQQRSLYFTSEPVFVDYNFEVGLWELLKSDEIELYTPEKKESIKFTTKTNSIWHQLKLFETKFLNEDLCVLYTGGPVWGLAWAPGESDVQYLAISTHLSMHSSFCIGSVHMGPSVIQLWSLNNINNLSPLSNGKIKLEYVFCHDFGGCWALEWCPAGCQDKSRIGIVAVATTSGVIPVFVVPTPQTLCSLELAEETKHFKVEPTLLLKLSDGISSQCTRLSWSKVKPHRTIVAGFANGVIGIWDLTSQSVLLRSENTLYPFKTFHAHHSNITGLCLSPTSEMYLVSSASDKTVKFWDLNNTTSPQCIHRRGLANDVTWMHHWLCAVAVYDESYLTGQTTVALHSIRDYIYQPCSFVSTVKSSAWCVSVSDWLNAIATSYDNGQITIAFAKQHDQNAEKRDQKRKVVKVILETSLFDFERKAPVTLNRVNTKLGPNSTMSSSCLSGSSMAKSSFNLTPKPSTSSAVDQCEPRTVDCCTYEEVSEKYGIRFDSDVNFSAEVDGNQPNPIDIYPLMSANKVTWNPNMNAFETLAVGYQSGFVVIPKLTLPQFDQSHIESFLKTSNIKEEGSDPAQ